MEIKIKKYFFVIYLLTSISLIYSSEISNKPKIVVLNFKAMRVSKDLAETVRENFTTSLVETNSFTVIERSQLDAIFKEMQLTSSDEFDDNQAIQIGRLAKAKFAVVGSISLLGSKYTINVRIIEIETGNITFAKKSSAESEDELFYVVDDLVSEFTTQKQGSNTSNTKVTKKKDTNVDPEIKQLNRSEMQTLYNKYRNSLKSGISNLIGGLITLGIFVPLTYVSFYLYEREVKKDEWERSQSLIDTYQGIAVISLIVAIIGGIVTIVGVGNLIAAGVYYTQYKALSNQAILPIIDVKDDKLIFGLNIKLKS